MKLEDYYVLNEMLGEFRREAADLEAQMNHCERRVKEAEAHLKVFEDQESDDRKVFSPRKAGVLYKEEIERIRKEKSACEEERQYLSEKKSIVDGRIKRIFGVIDGQEKSFTVQEKTDNRILDATVESLDELTERIEKTCLQIQRNPIQARQDFAIIAKSLRETTDKIRNRAE